jgi:SNF2 family DNA or RNA helicase
MKILKAHQHEALKYLSTKMQGALLMEMRLGKNLSIIRDFKEKGIGSKRILFITLYGAMQSIEDELVDEELPVTVLTGSRAKRLKLLSESREKGGWVISNYESAERLMLHEEDWTAVILDETIKISNPRSKVTKYFISKVWKKFALRYFLNGKVNPESLFQICCQFLFIHDTYMGCRNFWEYRSKYFIQTSEWDWTPKPGHKQQVWDYVHATAFVKLRKDANIGPDKMYRKRRIAMNPAQKKAVKLLAEDFAIGDKEYKNDLGVQIGMSYLASGMMPDGSKEILSYKKVEELLQLITQEIDGKILVWCRFKAEVWFIARHLNQNRVNNIVITGDYSKDQRKEIKKEFDSDPTCKVAILTEASCAKGQDWSSADTAIYYSNEWSNDLRGQSEDRLVHLEKKNPVLIIDLITETSVDEQVVEGLRTKEFDSKLIMGNYLKKFSKTKNKNKNNITTIT